MTDGNNFGGQDQSTGAFSYLGEGKKYATVEELDKAYAHANDHMGKLESDNATLRAQLEKFQSQDDAVAKVLDALKPKVQETDQDQASSHHGVKPEELESVVEQLLKRERESTQKRENYSRVMDSLKDKYGDRAEEVFNQRAKDLGVDLKALSESSPPAVLEFFKTSGRGESGQHSTFNSNALDAGAPKHGTHKYWQKLYEEKKISREEKFRQQHKSLEQLGQDYWN